MDAAHASRPPPSTADVSVHSALAPTSAIANEGTLNVVNASALTLSGAISGSGALAKSGTGALTLSGTNSYQGATTVTAGTLRVSGYLGDTTAVSVAAGASYQAASSDTVGSTPAERSSAAAARPSAASAG